MTKGGLLLVSLLAWVLWQKMMSDFQHTPPLTDWEPQGAHESKEDCEATIDGYYRSRGPAASGYRLENNRTGFILYKEDTKQIILMVSFVCLPDTVDPRPRK
jgi:hypothetical protein